MNALPCVLLQNAERLDSEIVYDRDFDYDYFGFKVGVMGRGYGKQHPSVLASMCFVQLWGSWGWCTVLKGCLYLRRMVGPA
jgi:hypothetical protein